MMPFWSRLVNQPAAALLHHAHWLHRDRKFVATSLSVVLAWLGSLATIFIVQAGEPRTAGAVAFVVWQVAYTFDCLDGRIARRTGTASPAGAGVDAIADVLSMAAVGAASVFAAVRAVPDGAALAALMVVVATARAAGPLWTVASRLVVASAGEGSVQTRGMPRAVTAAWAGLTHLSDYGLVLLLLPLAIALENGAVWLVVGIYCAVSSVVVAVAGFLHMSLVDKFR